MTARRFRRHSRAPRIVVTRVERDRMGPVKSASFELRRFFEQGLARSTWCGEIGVAARRQRLP